MTSLLLADDNLRDQERYRTFLADRDLELLFCGDGAAALRLATASEPRVHVAVILWELPGQPSGSELLPLLQRRRPDLPVLMVSGLLDLSRAARALALGARDFLLKPLERDRFVEAVRLALGEDQKPPLLGELRQRIRGESRPFLAMLEELATVIPARAETVLLIGENGTGKELLARAIHDLSALDKSKWVPINVASIPPTLVESTLFGHEAGAFTDARSQRIGLFEESGTGTLFLDEIGELDLPLQAKLLRILQERSFRRVGGSEDQKFKARLVAATNRDLVAEEKAGRFRRDLYFRLSSHTIRVPPLRDRPEDLWLLVTHFLRQYGGGRCVRLARETEALLGRYGFPGNVRELEGLIKGALLKCPGEEILPYHLPLELMQQRQATPAAESDKASFPWPEPFLEMPQKQAMLEIEKAFDREYLPRKLREARNNITQAARMAGLDPKTFRSKWKQAGLEPLSGPE